MRDAYSAYEEIGIAVRSRSNEFMEAFSPAEQNMDGINMVLSMLTVPVAGGGAMFFKHSKFYLKARITTATLRLEPAN